MSHLSSFFSSSRGNNKQKHSTLDSITTTAQICNSSSGTRSCITNPSAHNPSVPQRNKALLFPPAVSKGLFPFSFLFLLLNNRNSVLEDHRKGNLFSLESMRFALERLQKFNMNAALQAKIEDMIHHKYVKNRQEFHLEEFLFFSNRLLLSTTTTGHRPLLALAAQSKRISI
jgi:hypothetical protein